jgi:hypothetical protein
MKRKERWVSKSRAGTALAVSMLSLGGISGLLFALAIAMHHVTGPLMLNVVPFVPGAVPISILAIFMAIGMDSIAPWLILPTPGAMMLWAAWALWRNRRSGEDLAVVCGVLGILGAAGLMLFGGGGNFISNAKWANLIWGSLVLLGLWLDRARARA